MFVGDVHVLDQVLLSCWVKLDQERPSECMLFCQPWALHLVRGLLWGCWNIAIEEKLWNVNNQGISELVGDMGGFLFGSFDDYLAISGNVGGAKAGYQYRELGRGRDHSE